VGLLFRASDVVVLPYRRIYQSGVLALSYAQGRPVIVADVGSMREDVSDGETGMVFEGGSVEDLAQTIRKYFASSLFENLDETSGGIAEYGRRRFSWSANAAATLDVYRRLDGALR
jgi:D-inositol-3-phosphate glycosyltransferase